ncbi:conserved Plasmodium protein, unknown function [Plasmodium berghei]|uniref:Uncharacterized protein n=2 Tax=Plasmodium berghei TaxID=5821 RepID=A0A509AQB5_PLABA|nr:conserved Plasmodium protein, unknown function [Plasmodium berghei ANKA]CXI76106.1 conserved Plasmodium protein, unknown function [Plasmodium berghei]SCM24895.1 conserved Plasmodium protein, unknown function [Plasmodium berghei]SCN27200.1 conserved Plasmodium protein, unknown function [Plasmodium berghei]SCO61763.1 conserved Plasmodium protein, unknown function [Plasmodium berghei]SCO63624.1 conserved Plasmodium protein, unknown function [Plasmodium berghei]|eukprot:XP_034422835.1 conserved Plasmodium protein, unknown function [Plasmodium berghei ANKA]
MSSIIDKNKKKEEIHLLKAKELKEKIETIKNDLETKTKLISELKEQRIDKIKNIKELEIKNNANYKNFINEYENILNQYQNIEKDIYEMLGDLALLSEKSYNEILELREKNKNILVSKDLIIEKIKKEFQEQMKIIDLEISKHSNMLNGLLLKICGIFKKTHVQYQNDKELRPLLIRLKSIGKN